MTIHMTEADDNPEQEEARRNTEAEFAKTLTQDGEEEESHEDDIKIPASLLD